MWLCCVGAAMSCGGGGGVAPACFCWGVAGDGCPFGCMYFKLMMIIIKHCCEEQSALHMLVQGPCRVQRGWSWAVPTMNCCVHPGHLCAAAQPAEQSAWQRLMVVALCQGWLAKCGALFGLLDTTQRRKRCMVCACLATCDVVGGRQMLPTSV